MRKGFAGLAVLLTIGIAAVVSFAVSKFIEHPTLEVTREVVREIPREIPRETIKEITKETIRESRVESQPAQIVLGADNSQFVAAPPSRLAGSGIGITDTSIKLQKFKTRSGVNITMTDFGDTGYGTLEPESDAKFELVSFTGLTQNSDGTATLTGVTRGLLPVAPYTASTTLRLSHSGGARFIISNPPQLYAEAAFKDNDESVTGQWSFPTSTASAAQTGTGFVMDGTFPTSTLANIDYVNRVATSGVADASQTVAGKVEIATGAETASSTGAGGTTALLVPPASLFTSTSSASGKVPVVGPNNKLSQNFLNLAESYAWTEPHTFSSSTRLSASSTIGVAGATSTFRGGLDFTNASTTGLVISNLIEASSTNVSAIETTATTTLFTVPIPANILIGNNVVVADVYFSLAQQNGAGDNHQFRASYGGTNFATLNIQATTPDVLTGKLEIYLIANGSSAQEGGITARFQVQPSAAGTVAIATNTLEAVGNTVGTSSVSGTASQNLVLTVTNNFSIAAKGVTMSGYIVRKVIKE